MIRLKNGYGDSDICDWVMCVDIYVVGDFFCIIFFFLVLGCLMFVFVFNMYFKVLFFNFGL